MPCYHPKHMFDCSSIYGLTPNGKPSLKFCQGDTERLFYSPSRRKFAEDKGQLIWIDSDYIEMPFACTVPCGQCEGCRIDHSREWANRLCMELPYHESAYFITLTYNDEYAYNPVNDLVRCVVDPDTGECLDGKYLSLSPRGFGDLRSFWDRCRHSNTKPIMYFACGEYGENTHRPHYHAIVFDLELDDLELWKRTEHGAYWRSAKLEHLWSYTPDHGQTFVPIGNVLVCDVSWNTCAYVARYVTKKLTGKASVYYDRANLIPEYQVQSLKPAIGKRYFDDHWSEIYADDRIYLPGSEKGITCRPPRYFDKLFEQIDPDRLAELKSHRREVAEYAQDLKAAFSEFDLLDQLLIDEQVFHDRISVLLRNKI